MMEAIFSFNTLWWVLMLLFVPCCLALVIMVLLQQGKGTGFGGAFGAGAGPGADTVFGPKGAQSVPVKITYVLAGIFMFVSVVMSLIAGRLSESAAPALIEGAEGLPAVSVSSSALSERGLGTGIINNDPDAPGSAPIENATEDEDADVIQETTIQSTPDETVSEETAEETPNAEN